MNVTNFLYTDEVADGDIRMILTYILNCHKLMIAENRQVKNNENFIRNVLMKDYLKNPKVKKKLGITAYKFQPESPVINDAYSEIGRTDIEVSLIDYFDDDDAVYRIECKRLDGQYSLNSEYVKEGIMRFVGNKYQTFFGFNGMLAFCIKPFDIEANTLKINKYIDNLCAENTEKSLVKSNFLDDEANTFLSEHSLASNPNGKFSLYHLMLDFSTMIEP